MPVLWLGEGFTLLTAASAVTERVRLGVLVASAAFRTPVPLARIAMTTHDISGGRLVLGLGTGAPFCAVADRGVAGSVPEMSDRFLDVGEGYVAALNGATEWQGETISFGGLETTAMLAGAVAPEQLIAGHGPRSLALAATHADTWSTYGGPAASKLERDDFWPLIAKQVDAFARAREEQGRDPRAVRRSALLGFGKVNPSASVDTYLDAAERADELGFDELVVHGLHWATGTPSDVDVQEQAFARLR